MKIVKTCTKRQSSTRMKTNLGGNELATLLFKDYLIISSKTRLGLIEPPGRNSKPPDSSNSKNFRWFVLYCRLSGSTSRPGTRILQVARKVMKAVIRNFCTLRVVYIRSFYLIIDGIPSKGKLLDGRIQPQQHHCILPCQTLSAQLSLHVNIDIKWLFCNGKCPYNLQWRVLNCFSTYSIYQLTEKRNSVIITLTKKRKKNECNYNVNIDSIIY